MPSISIPAITSAIATGLGGLGIGAETAGTIAGIASPMLTGSGIGALGGALTGGNVGQDALFGALGGAGSGALGAAFPETMASLDPFGATATMGANGAYIPGAQGFAAPAAGNALVDPGMAAADASANYGSGALPGAINAAGSPMGAATGAATNGLSSTMRTLQGLGALGQIAGAIAGPAKPNYGILPGPSANAATLGPLFNKTLQTQGYLNRSPVQNYLPNSGWYNYGLVGNQPQFFDNNKLTFPGMAKGGALCMSCGGKMAGGGGTGALGDVAGAGDGQSDSIPARLSDGEYVIDAGTVSRLGNGSTKAGVVKLDRMRSQIARDAGAKKIQGKVKEPVRYLRKAS